ncbi:uncharacterized protein ACNS7B_012046 isoform 2-T2 [Menidia menidia]
MRRFFRAQRDEDFSQIQYLTAKCTRLAHDKGVLDREFLVSRDRERKLQMELEAVTNRLQKQENLTFDLRRNQDLLELVEALQHRLLRLAEDSSGDAHLLGQVSLELQGLQSSEAELQGLVDELHAEAHGRAALAEGLHAELHRKTVELEELQVINKNLREELRDLRETHQREVRDLRRENEGSLKKLQETAEQFEWLCEQQRFWICCVKRFKDSLMEEKQTLLRRVSQLEKKTGAETDCPPSYRPLLDTKSHSSLTSSEAAAHLEPPLEESKMYEELLNQAESLTSRNREPP